MKIKINRNIIWTETFIKVLVSAGIRYACISPGSRSTPLTYAVTRSEIKTFIHIDERSGAFFATGLARTTGTPVLLICTSGTAAAEFYPAVIEAYQQRIPLIVCTADRPAGSFSKGLNQTINQDNLYKNHIQWYTDAGLPDVHNLQRISSIAVNALQECFKTGRPVHINFPFDKPFEPENYTDEIETSGTTSESYTYRPEEMGSIPVGQVAGPVMANPEGLIAVGPSAFPSTFRDAIVNLSSITGYPIFADGASRLRFGREISRNIFTNFDAVIRAGYFGKAKPALIIHFGRNMTSKSYEDFLLGYYGLKYIINKYGDISDPAGRYDLLITSDEEQFARTLTDYLHASGFRRNNSEWFLNASRAEAAVCELKKEIVCKEEFPDESRIITEIISLLPENSNVMLSNSMPVRDFDYFAEQTSREIKVYHNRGASGIDGIISTALGIASGGQITVLFTGDLAFYHDMNGLIASGAYKIPLIIILINNNGGGIFRALPISSHSDIFEKFFVTPHNLEFRKFVEGYGGNYKLAENWTDLETSFKSALVTENLTVLEIRTSAGKSLQNRRNFWNKVKEKLVDTGLI